MKKTRTVVDTSKTGMGPRELMIGVEASGASRAYRFERVLSEKLIQDRVGGEAILIVVGLDGKSVRAFFAELPGSGSVPEFYRKEEIGGGLIADSETGGEWSFQGCAISGPLVGKCLAPLKIVKDYWFDWHLYHPRSSISDR